MMSDGITAVGSPASIRSPIRATSATPGRSENAISSDMPLVMNSLMATHQYFTSPYLLPTPSTTPEIMQTMLAQKIVKTAHRSISWNATPATSTSDVHTPTATRLINPIHIRSDAPAYRTSTSSKTLPSRLLSLRVVVIEVQS